MSFNLRIFPCPIVITYCIIFIITSFIAEINITVGQQATLLDSSSVTSAEPQDKPIIFNIDDCENTVSPITVWRVDFKVGINEKTCFKELINIRTFECMDYCLSFPDAQCNTIVRKKVDDEKLSSCFIKICDSSNATVNDEDYISYATLKCNLIVKNYTYLPDLFLTPFIFHPETQCQQLKMKVNISACDYLSWHMQESIGLPVKSYRTKVNFPLPICLTECIQDVDCKGVIVENVPPFGSICHFYNLVAAKNEGESNKVLYEKICCPMQPVDKAENKLILYSPYVFFCHHHIVNYSSDCTIKFWIMRENKKVQGTYTKHILYSIQACLLKCFRDTNCIAANIDQYNNTCLIVTYISKYIPSHTKYTVYNLACCKETDTPALLASAKKNNLTMQEQETIIKSIGIYSVIGIVICLFLILSTCVYIPLYVYWFRRLNI